MKPHQTFAVLAFSALSFGFNTNSDAAEHNQEPSARLSLAEFEQALALGGLSADEFIVQADSGARHIKAVDLKVWGKFINCIKTPGQHSHCFALAEEPHNFDSTNTGYCIPGERNDFGGCTGPNSALNFSMSIRPKEVHIADEGNMIFEYDITEVRTPQQVAVGGQDQPAILHGRGLIEKFEELLGNGNMTLLTLHGRMLTIFSSEPDSSGYKEYILSFYGLGQAGEAELLIDSEGKLIAGTAELLEYSLNFIRAFQDEQGVPTSRIPYLK